MKKTTSPDRKRSRGALLLSRVPATREEVGTRVGVSLVAVVYWISGQTRPSAEKRELLRVAYNIPVESWEEEPTEADNIVPSTATTIPIPEGVAGKVAILETLAIEMIEAIRAPAATATPKERVGILKDAVATLDKLSRITGEYNVERKILTLPRWKQIERTCEEALRPFPEAAKALQDALIKLDQAS